MGCGVWRTRHQCSFGVLHRSAPQPSCSQNSLSTAARQPAGGTETLRWPQSRSEYAHVRLTWRASRLSGQLYFHARLHELPLGYNAHHGLEMGEAAWREVHIVHAISGHRVNRLPAFLREAVRTIEA